MIQLTLNQLITTQADRNPAAIAVVAPDCVPLTYHQLQLQITELVESLKQWGIGPGDRVAVVLPNGPQMAVAFVGIASGATCAPLNPNYQAAEFEFYLQDLQAVAIVILAGMETPARAVAQTQGIPILELVPDDRGAGRFQLVGQGARSAATPRRAQPEDVALVLHTSGTTSRPKQVPLTHTNLCTSADNIRRTLGLDSGDRCLNVMPLFHIHGLIGVLLSSLAAGGSVVCTPGFDPSQFFEQLTEFQPTWYSAVPTMHQAILAQAEAQAASDSSLLTPSSLRLIRSSSAALPVGVLTALKSRFGVPVIEAYGMTEAAHQMASNPLPPAAQKPGSVGLAVGLELAIMDQAGNLQLPGDIGEVVIRGGNVTLGYANNPEATATAYTQGWFRTGDQGYLDPEGYLFLQGRLKEIINRGGEKVAPAEVDAVLMELPEVFQAVTFAVAHPTLGEDVAAAVVLHDRASFDPAAMRAFLFQRLAAFKVPSQIIAIDAIPKGATGKLQRIGLGEKLAAALQSQTVAPRDQIEKTIAAILSAGLGIVEVGIYDNFFGLGGDSIRGAQVAGGLSQEFGIEIAPELLFHHPTIAELAPVIAAQIEALESPALDDLLQDLQNLSPEALDKLLANLPD